MNTMPDPSGERDPSSTEVSVGKTKVLNLDYKVAGLLCYLPICAVNLICSVVILATEPKNNRFLRFHSIQSLALCGAYIVVGAAVWMITLSLVFVPFLSFIVSLVQLVWLVVTVIFVWKCISCMIDAYHGRMSKLPWIGPIAEDNA